VCALLAEAPARLIQNAETGRAVQCGYFMFSVRRGALKELISAPVCDLLLIRLSPRGAGERRGTPRGPRIIVEISIRVRLREIRESRNSPMQARSLRALDS
jgi:hypothetical protein